MKMDMTVKFTEFGLDFEAEIVYWPGTPGRHSGPPENCYPGEPPEVEFYSLVCGPDKNDTLVLLQSDELLRRLESAAGRAAEVELYGEVRGY